jgi:phosphohistidine phosphatase SixA
VPSQGFRLYIVRHAIAESRGEAYPDDDLRPLSERGTRRFRKVVRGLARIGVSLDCILSSPLTRARETAGRPYSIGRVGETSMLPSVVQRIV